MTSPEGENAMTPNFESLAARYVAHWNEPDAKARRAAIAALWHEEAVHQSPSYDVRGHAGLEARVAGAYERWVRDAGKRFELYGPIDGHHGAMRLRWSMRPAAGGPIEAVGFDLLVIGADGRIAADYQFSEPTPAS